VFATRAGTAFNYVAQRGLTKAADAAGLGREGQPSLTLHDLRHAFGSHLVRAVADVVTVSITLDVNAHEFAAVQHREDIAAKLGDAFNGILTARGI
jgi:integrase